MRIATPTSTMLQIHGADGRELLAIHPDGTVTGAIEDAGEAAARFMEAVGLGASALADLQRRFDRERTMNLEALFMIEALGGIPDDEEWNAIHQSHDTEVWARGVDAGRAGMASGRWVAPASPFAPADLT